jgi:hypothetical protein
MTVTQEPARDARPYWLREPCPPWCQRGHRDDHASGREDERLHSGDGVYMDLSKESGGDASGGVSFISAGIWQGYRDSRPHILLTLNDSEELYLELDEAEELARLLDDPAEEWASLLPTMMDTEIIAPAGFPGIGKPTPQPMAHFAAFPFTRKPVVAVRRVLDTVTVFAPVQAGQYHEQSPRYVALTPGEAAGLAAAIVKLPDGAR